MSNGNGEAVVKKQMENDGGGEGIFCKEATIIAARSLSNEDFYKNGRLVDVGIEFTLDIGKEFQPTFAITGNFKEEEIEDPITGEKRKTGKWLDSSTIKVKIALQNLGIRWKKLGPNNEIPKEILDQCIGKKIMRLQYPSGYYTEGEKAGKPRYRNYSYFLLASVPNAKELVRAKFDKDLKAGFVKINSDDMAFPPAAIAVPEPEKDQF